MPDPTSTAVLISNDLFFISKVQGTGSAVGLTVRVAGDAAALRRWFEESHNSTRASSTNAGESSLAPAGSRNDRPRGVLIDLEMNAFPIAQVMATVRALEAELSCRIVTLAFGPHVRTDLFDAAKEAGCDLVMPRSKFSAQLPDLLRQLLV